MEERLGVVGGIGSRVMAGRRGFRSGRKGVVCIVTLRWVFSRMPDTMSASRAVRGASVMDCWVGQVGVRLGFRKGQQAARGFAIRVGNGGSEPQTLGGRCLHKYYESYEDPASY